MASAPTASAASIFSISAGTEHRTLLVPTLALTFVRRTRPMPAGRRLLFKWALLAAMTSRPAAISLRTVCTSTPSLAATCRMASRDQSRLWHPSVVSSWLTTPRANKKIAPAGKRFLMIANTRLSSLSYAGISARCDESRHVMPGPSRSRRLS